MHSEGITGEGGMVVAAVYPIRSLFYEVRVEGGPKQPEQPPGKRL